LIIAVDDKRTFVLCRRFSYLEIKDVLLFQKASQSIDQFLNQLIAFWRIAQSIAQSTQSFSNE
jgi:hypothetical protein